MSDKRKHPGVEDAGQTAFEAEASKPAAEKKGLTLKVRRVGNSLGVVLPKQVLAKLRVSEGGELTVTETPDGVALTAYDEETARQLELMRDIMRRYRNTLRELAR